MTGAGDLLEKEKVVKYIIKKYKVPRERAKEVFEIIKKGQNKKIPDVQKLIEGICV